MGHNEMLDMLHSIRNKETLQRDFYEIAMTARGMLHEKYISRIHAALHEHSTQARQNPPKEARLLEAWKPFLPKEKHEAIDRCVEFFLAHDACRKLSESISMAAPPHIRAASVGGDPSIHHDGVYDVDTQCARPQGQTANRAAQPTPTVWALVMLLMLADTPLP